MKSSFICFVSALVLASISYAVPVDELSGKVSGNQESTRGQPFRDLSDAEEISSTSDSAKENVDGAPESPLLGLPSDIWRSHILPRIPTINAGKMRQTGKELHSMIGSRLKDFHSVAKTCGNETANVLIKQQWYSGFRQNVKLVIKNQIEAERAHECLWATKRWVDTLEDPQNIRLNIELGIADKTADFLLDDQLFEDSGKSRFAVGIEVSQRHGSLDKVFQAVSTNNDIRALDLQQYYISDEQAATLAKALKHNKGLKVLDLSQTDMGDHGAIALAKGLAGNTALLELELNCNFIGDEGAKALGEALTKNTKLQILQLESNSIGPYGAKFLAEGLKHAALSRLNLRKNHIGEEGAIALARALRTNSQLENLDLEINQIGPTGGKALADAGAVNKAEISI